MSLGPAEILVIFVVALLVFGPTRLPEVGRQVGRGIRELRKFQQSFTSELHDLIPEDVSDHTEPAPALPPVRSDAPTDPASDATPPTVSDTPEPSGPDAAAPPPDSTA